MSLGSFINKKRAFNLSGALLILLSQLLFSFVPFIGLETAQAAGTITVADHEGQENPAGTYTNGDVKTYKELDSINFRFDITSSGSTSGTMKVSFAGQDSKCLFFDGTFAIGTHDGSATGIQNVSGASPTVTKVGNAIPSGGDWVQTLQVDFTAAGSAVVNYYLTLTDNAGECVGSSTHTSFGGVTGDFANIGAQTVPIPAKDIIALPSILVQKWVDDDADGKVDRKANAGEWSFSLDGATPVATDANGEVLFVGVSPDGAHQITESNGPDGQSFLSGSGTNCTFNDNGVATATVASSTGTPSDATCVFNNGVAGAQISIVKDAVPNDEQDFSFTSTGDRTSNFTLDDDGSNDNGLSNTKTFSGLAAGTYTFTEAQAAGWYLDDISCPNITETKDIAAGTVSLTVSAGQNITCTFTNRKLGQIIVTKQTLPDGDPTNFSITATPGSGVVGDATQTIADDETETYVVKHGTYAVNESVPAGWMQTSNNCSGLVIDGNTPVVHGIPTRTCTINNTKNGVIQIIKDAVPNDGQDFVFPFDRGQGQGVQNYILDDDSDGDRSNNLTFSLAPGNYTVSEQSTSGWKLTSLVCNDQPYDGASAQLSLAPGENISCTFTNTKLVKIGGTKFEVDAGTTNGLPGTGLSGWRIILDLDGSGTENAGDRFAVTDIDGTYSFEDVLYGTHILLFEVLQPGYTQIFAPDPVGFTVESVDDVVNLDFGNFENNSLRGNKFNDQDGDGHVSLTDENLEGWTINLKLDTDDDNDFTDEAILATDVTDASGFLFENLAPGHYQVCEVLQNGWTATYPADESLCHEFLVATSGQTFSRFFGNFQSGSVSGYKWNDVNGNTQYDDEPKLSGWTINLFDSNNQQIDSDITEADGSYSFTGLVAGDYSVCEVQQAQAGWVQTFPVQNGCHYFTINESGEQNTANFGNQGRGSITVIKNVDGDGDGNIDQQDSPDWTWDIDGEGNFITGSGNSQSIAAGNYRITENQDDLFNLTAIDCSGDGNDISVRRERADVAVSPGENVICTFTNTRKTGKLGVLKALFPTNDEGLFDLNIDTTTYKDDASNGDSTGYIQLPTGSYNVSETAGSNTDMSEYDSYYGCAYRVSTRFGTFYIPFTLGEGTEISDINVAEDKTILCTFLNKKKPTLTIVKNSVPHDDQNFCFNVNKFSYQEPAILSLLDEENTEEQECDFILDDGDDKDNYENEHTQVLDKGKYIITEEKLEGWRLDDIYCEGARAQRKGNMVFVDLGHGDDVTCTFTNYKDSNVRVTKFNDYDRDGEKDENEPTLEGWEMNLAAEGRCEEQEMRTNVQLYSDEYEEECYISYSYDESGITGDDGSVTFENVKPFTDHYLFETEKEEWTWSNTYCEYKESEGYAESDNYYELYAFPGETLECFVGNYQDSALNLTKSNNQVATGSPGDIVTYTLTVTVPEDVDELFDAEVIDLPPENVDVLEGTETASSNKSGPIAVNPSYASPGKWKLGDLVPGEVVTLSYEAQISRTISSGVYPDIAYALAYDSPDKNPDRLLFANADAPNPFVATDIAVATPAAPVLANTGSRLMLAQFVVPILAIITAVALLPRRKKGGRA